ncbi:MAG: hypothetical protein U1E70_13385 [Acetobacteraceae bacterium]
MSGQPCVSCDNKREPPHLTYPSQVSAKLLTVDGSVVPKHDAGFSDRQLYCGRARVGQAGFIGE